ncbi:MULTISPECIES: phage tail tape measure protein [unclassified Citrobacter]|uniref:phage tail tape measure protein n=1 Tax=unclassified Citrobacter TaxID=2644389 RepID=UPI0015E969C7|nr:MULTISPECIES: phage tail tape measure protein [unclassified Citrobacter]MBA7877203.1 phage tail tape measure protein [Citrobacter sp. RHBSTW-00827]MBA7937755.1 phage tail tape measure protein [Citrobacter sp. RHBSTW-00509]QLS93858.1 phage tail tape measure protein [Citrobacter sp. RHBSTW-00859]QLT53243.1 phage tail tape measure protein [Citrobacter sp. RHBSTW-00821]QLU29528.1 phage tail tape measure protein [Citrobacter sp. RHBSTW-00446]
MTDQIASITLRADVADLKTASNELDKLGEAAAGAVGKADDLNSVFRAGAESTKQGTAGIKEQQTALKGLLENIDPVNKALNRLDEQQAALRNFQSKGFLDTDSFQAYSKILDDTRLKLTDTGEAAAKAQAELAATQAAEKQSAALKGLLGSIDPTIRAFNSLDEQHAQLVAHFEAGRINGAQFEHFNDVLNQTRQRLSSVADVLPEALSRQEVAARRAGLSVGQYNQALRMLPAQFTDIATQLAGGQSPFLILLQQGGQIKDSFGGVGNTLKVFLSFLNPINAALSLSALAFGVLAVAVYKARQQIDEASKITTSSLGASGDAAERLALNMVAISDKTGKAIDEVSKMFITTNDGASESIKKLIDVGYSYDEARKEVEKYKSTGNFTALNADIDAHRREILKIGDAWSEAAIKEKNKYTGSNLGKQNVALGGGIDYGLKFIEQGIDLQKTMNQLTIDGNKAVADSVDWINKTWESTDRVAGAEARLKEAREQSRKIAFSGDKEAIANAQQLIALRQREVEDAIKQRDKKNNPKSPTVKVDAGDRTIENYQAQSRTLTQTLETLRQTGDTQVRNTELSKQQSRFAELDEAAKTRALTTQEKSLLSSREAILNAAKIVDQKNKEVEAQQKINGLAQQANKYFTQMSEKTDALRDSAGLSGRQTQRMMEEAQLRQGWLNGGGKLEDTGYEKELAALRNYYAEEDKLRGDWKAGALSGWNEYLEAATDTYSAVKGVAGSALTGLSDMLTDLMTTGKASIKSFGMSMLKMITQVVNQLMVAYAVQAAMGWINGGASSSPGGGQSFAVPSYTPNAKGGVYDSPGLSKYVNGVYDSPQYFTFQGASKFAKGGVFAEAGAEAIMPLTRDSAGRLGVRAQGGGGSQPQVNIDIYVDNKGNSSSTTSGDGSDAARALGKEIEAKVTEVLVRASRSDGLLGRQFQPK